MVALVSRVGMGGVIYYIIIFRCNEVIRKVRCKRYRCITLHILYMHMARFRDLKVVNFGPDFHQVKVPRPYICEYLRAGCDISRDTT